MDSRFSGILAASQWRFSGAGKVAFNLAVLLATISVTGAGMLALFERGGNALLYYLLGLLILQPSSRNDGC